MGCCCDELVAYLKVNAECDQIVISSKIVLFFPLPTRGNVYLVLWHLLFGFNVRTRLILQVGAGRWLT